MPGRAIWGYIFLTFLLISVNIIINAGSTGSTAGKGADAVTGEVRGIITRAVTDEPMAGATAALLGTRQGAISDSNGVFRIGRIPPGTYDLRISACCYQSEVVESVVVSAGEVVEVSCQLVRCDEPSLSVEAGERVISYYVSSVIGILTDSKSGVPISSASVTINPGGTFRTSDAGRFYLEPLKPGKYDIGITHPDYESISLNGIEFAEGVIVYAAFQLTRKTPPHGGVDGNDRQN